MTHWESQSKKKMDSILKVKDNGSERVLEIYGGSERVLDSDASIFILMLYINFSVTSLDAHQKMNGI